MRIIWIIMCAVSALAAIAARAEDNGPTARGIFAMLPPSIFENTRAGLDETDKQALLHTGYSQYWEIAGETSDILVFAELPFRERTVALRLFRNEEDGSTDVAVGTLGETICAIELWRLDVSGRLVPVDTPPEPAIEEFFISERTPPKSRQNSVLICLGLGGLWAKPVFWNKYGVTAPDVDNEISFQWIGNRFEKVREAKRSKNKERELPAK